MSVDNTRERRPEEQSQSSLKLTSSQQFSTLTCSSTDSRRCFVESQCVLELQNSSIKSSLSFTSYKWFLPWVQVVDWCFFHENWNGFPRTSFISVDIGAVARFAFFPTRKGMEDSEFAFPKILNINWGKSLDVLGIANTRCRVTNLQRMLSCAHFKEVILMDLFHPLPSYQTAFDI